LGVEPRPLGRKWNWMSGRCAPALRAGADAHEGAALGPVRRQGAAAEVGGAA
jgi:hypothetical protein